MRWLLSICILMSFLCFPAFAEAPYAAKAGKATKGSRKYIGIEVAMGTPQVVSAQLTFLALGSLIFGVGFGYAPINSFLQSRLRSYPMPVDLGTPDPYVIIPSATFSFSVMSAFIRYQPSGGGRSGFFVELNYAQWNFGANLGGDLRNENTHVITPRALYGTLDLRQPILTGAIGYRFGLAAGFGIQFQLGASYLFRPVYASDIQGDIPAVLPSAPFGDAALAEAKGNLDRSVGQAIDNAQRTTKFLPSLSVTMGYAF